MQKGAAPTAPGRIGDLRGYRGRVPKHTSSFERGVHGDFRFDEPIRAGEHLVAITFEQVLPVQAQFEN